jgi:tRNA U34 5-methylaminomethyl-2-thiouridine-forming methyltransferase MnmC
MQQLEHRLQVTKDGSHTIAIPELNITFHSHHGAIPESQHVFIQAGLHEALERFAAPLHIAETGFGTGLNALLTAMEARQTQTLIHFTTLELYPLPQPITAQLNHGQLLGEDDLLQQLHAAPWNETVTVHPWFILNKQPCDIATFETSDTFHVVYFDAFAPEDQPELWTVDVFRQWFNLLKPGGMLVTYCSKSIIRKAMAEAGFTVTKIPGPWGKREMVRAFKPVEGPNDL